MTRCLEELASPYLSGLIPYSPGKPIEENAKCVAALKAVLEG